jgi:2-oxoisovalerate dehydrogenase E2 component (dihydrolipoyl transacylase)
MAELKEFKLPDVGEGLTEADIVTWRVKPGDRVEVNQIIVDIETAKAVVELPSPWDGTVARLLAEEGQTVDVGVPIIAIDVSAAPAQPAVAASAGKTDDSERTVVPVAGPPPGGSVADAAAQESPAGSAGGAPPRVAVLVGYGVKASSTTRRARKVTQARPETAEVPTGPQVATEPPEVPADVRQAPAARVLAKPPVRKLAKDLGISLTELAGTGPDGSITRDDVQRAAGGTAVRSDQELAENGSRPATWPAAAGPGGEERIPVRGVRKHMAAAMVSSAFTAPHVTEFLQVDATETMAAVRRVRDLPEYAEVRVSPLLFVARALLIAARRHPLVNSSWDADAHEIVIKHYVNLGIAVAAERGLLVPNIKNAGELSLTELAAGLHELAETARTGRATPADLTGGTITITNVGVFGVDGGTPILTPGEAAILAFGQVRDAPWVVDGQLAVRQVTTLSLSFDHRIVDGELGSAVLRDVGSMLQDPTLMLAWS